MKFKYSWGIAVLMAVLICLAGCSGKENKLSVGNSSVDRVLKEQVANAENNSTTDAQGESFQDTEAAGDSAKSDEADKEEQTGEETQEEAQEDGTPVEEIDYDLTAMGSDMAYALVSQFNEEPKSYLGKTVRVAGSYYTSFSPKTNSDHHYVTVLDAAGCCVQALEFIWEDGSHIYPDEYPAPGHKLEVTGVFETYVNEGSSNLNCRLKDASLKIVD